MMATDLPALLKSNLLVRPLNVYEEGDCLVICGVHYAGDLFRAMRLANPGSWLRIESRKDGVLSVYTPTDEMERTFDTLSGRAAASRA